MMNYYNEFDPVAAAWLRELISNDLIPFGVVDERSIADVRPGDVKGFTQCHFFAGIGGWSHALRLAGWSDDRPVWTGSPPCQPFSNAGKQQGKADERHLWPAFFNLIRECRPPAVFGEQVASAIAHGWFDDLQADLEAENYACGMVVLPACSVGAPHIRQRLFYVAKRMAHADSKGWGQAGLHGKCDPEAHHGRKGNRVGDGSADDGQRSMDGIGLAKSGSEQQTQLPDDPVPLGRERIEHFSCAQQASEFEQRSESRTGQTGPTNAPPGGWDAPDWLYCRDGKWRPVEPGTFPLAHGVSARVGRLRGYGNAIVPQVAAEVIKAIMDKKNPG